MVTKSTLLLVWVKDQLDLGQYWIHFLPHVYSTFSDTEGVPSESPFSTISMLGYRILVGQNKNKLWASLHTNPTRQT
jgi:hypothetical protein